MESNFSFAPSGNYWDIFKQIPKNERSKHLQNNVNLKQIEDKLEMLDHKYP